MTSIAIEVDGLTKSYGELQVLKGISFSIRHGEIFSILGPNGAGKTTCIEILEGYRQSDSGVISVLGYDPQSQDLNLKQRIGIVAQTSGIEEELTVLEAINLYASCYENPRNSHEMMELVNLQSKASARVSKLSGGQRRKLDLALGLVGDPDLIFLDEPTTGFSPEARRESWDMLLNLRSAGKTILLTSHYMEEVDWLADRMVVLLDGKIVREGKPTDLKHGQTHVEFRLPTTWRVEHFQSLPMTEVSVKDGMVSGRTEVPTSVVNALTSKALEEGIELEDLSVQMFSLEDAYLEIIKSSRSSDAAPQSTVSDL